MSAATPVVLVGGGGHASDILGVIEACNEHDPTYHVLGYFDDNRPGNNRLERRDVAYLGPISGATEVDAHVVLAVGTPSVRALIANELIGIQTTPALVHPSATVGRGGRFEAGVVILPGAVLSADVTIGEHSHIGQNATVGHDCSLAPFVSIYPGATVGGEVTIGRTALVGSGATIFPGRTIGANSRVGAGAVLLSDLPARTTAIGVPARWQ